MIIFRYFLKNSVGKRICCDNHNGDEAGYLQRYLYNKCKDNENFDGLKFDFDIGLLDDIRDEVMKMSFGKGESIEEEFKEEFFRIFPICQLITCLIGGVPSGEFFSCLDWRKEKEEADFAYSWCLLNGVTRIADLASKLKSNINKMMSDNPEFKDSTTITVMVVTEE